MKKSTVRLLCAVAFGYVFITFFGDKGNNPGIFSTSTVGAGAVTQCTRDPSSIAIDVTCPPYSAAPNDGQDDSRAFQAAIDALPRSGGTITIPSGTYLFNKPLII